MLILKIVSNIFEIYWYILIARIIMSWIPGILNTGFGEFIYKITEPYLAIFRSFIPPVSLGGGYLDLSPIIAFIAFRFIHIGAMSILTFVLKIIGLY